MTTSPDRTLSRRSILKGQLCQGLDLGVVAGAFCVCAAPANEVISRAMRLGFERVLDLHDTLVAVLGACVLLAGWRFALTAPGLYRRLEPSREARMAYWLRCLIALNGCTAVAAAALLVSGAHDLWRPLAGFWGASLLQMFAVRLLLLVLTEKKSSSLKLLTRPGVLVVGTGMRAREIYELLGRTRTDPCRLVGFVIASPEPALVPEELILGDLSGLNDLLLRLEVEQVVVALPLAGLYETAKEVVAICRSRGVEVHASAEYLDRAARPTRPLQRPSRTRRRRGRRRAAGEFTRRATDLVAAGAGLVVFSPILVLAGVSVRVTSPGPVFERELKNGPLRFRSTYQDGSGGAPRSTAVGSALRRSGFDRLPRLISLWTGELSLRDLHLLAGRQRVPQLHSGASKT